MKYLHNIVYFIILFFIDQNIKVENLFEVKVL